jgi:hypothetical protein
MKTYGGVGVQIRGVLTSRLVVGERLASRAGYFNPCGIHWIGSCVGIRGGLDDLEK